MYWLCTNPMDCYTLYMYKVIGPEHGKKTKISNAVPTITSPQVSPQLIQVHTVIWHLP